jgi:hypothetical protein
MRSEYDARVVGVISGAGNLRPGVIKDERGSDCSRAPVALPGKVYCKADATNSPILPGDALTTSSTKGHAMKAVDHKRAFESVIGKALGRLDSRRC